MNNTEIRYRLDDGDDWTQPDYGDYGLPCAIASLIAAWYSADEDAAINWAENIAHRIFLAGCWDERISMVAIHTNIAEIVDECEKAIEATNTDFDNIDEDAYEQAITNIGRLVGNIPIETSSNRKPKKDTVAAEAALALRYYWAAKLHEKNKRFAPDYDYKVAANKARAMGIDTDDDNYILQIIALIPQP